MTLISIVKNEDIVALDIKSKSKTLTEKEVNEQDEFGNTALHYAMQSGNWYIIKTLLELKGDLLKENKEGISALLMAKPDSIRRICVETEMKEKPNLNPEVSESEMNDKPKSETDEENEKAKDEIVQNMGFSSNTIRLKDGIQKHAELITNRLKETKNKLSKILVNVCNHEECYNNANCVFECGHILFCMEHGQKWIADKHKCPYCNQKLEDQDCYEITPII